jgi:phosphocarrier protein HPr
MTQSITRLVTVGIPEGLHLRPAGELVSAVERFRAQVAVSKNGQVADARSVMSLLALGAQHGELLELRAEGDEADQAVDFIAALLSPGPNGPPSGAGDLPMPLDHNDSRKAAR